jgi:hypothetical protein
MLVVMLVVLVLGLMLSLGGEGGIRKENSPHTSHMHQRKDTPAPHQAHARYAVRTSVFLSTRDGLVFVGADGFVCGGADFLWWMCVWMDEKEGWEREMEEEEKAKEEEEQ